MFRFSSSNWAISRVFALEFCWGKLTETMGNITKKSPVGTAGEIFLSVNLPEPHGQFNWPTSAQED